MTLNLLSAAFDGWDSFDGWATSRLGGGDPLDLPLDRFINLIWYYLTKGATPESVEKFKARLWIPPKGAEIPRESPWSAENEMAAFNTLMAQVGKSPKGAANAKVIAPS